MDGHKVLGQKGLPAHLAGEARREAPRGEGLPRGRGSRAGRAYEKQWTRPYVAIQTNKAQNPGCAEGRASPAKGCLLALGASPV